MDDLTVLRIPKIIELGFETMNKLKGKKIKILDYKWNIDNQTWEILVQDFD